MQVSLPFLLAFGIYFIPVVHTCEHIHFAPLVIIPLNDNDEVQQLPSVALDNVSQSAVLPVLPIFVQKVKSLAVGGASVNV